MCIESAVGPGKPNRFEDVLVIQALLNIRYVKRKICGVDELVEDGSWGKGTLGVVQRFQQREMGQAKPSGVIEPGSEDLKTLLKNTPIPVADWDASLLHVCMPKGQLAKMVKFSWPLKKTMAAYDISTGRRAAHFLAQIGHETDSLKWETEIASGEAYEGRKDLGNTKPGDGKKFKGRGLIQLTGRFNYEKYGTSKGIDLTANPEQVAINAELNADVAGWYWDSKSLNSYADTDDIKTITKKINGGFNGYSDRIRRFKVCYLALVGIDGANLKGWKWPAT